MTDPGSETNAKIDQLLRRRRLRTALSVTAVCLPIAAFLVVLTLPQRPGPYLQGTVETAVLAPSDGPPTLSATIRLPDGSLISKGGLSPVSGVSVGAVICLQKMTRRVLGGEHYVRRPPERCRALK